MSAYKDKKSGTWYAKVSYKGPDGKILSTTKRGFRLKSEALAWESHFYADTPSISNMLFSDFCEIYKKEHFKRIKEVTADSISNILDNKIIPAFGNVRLKDITVKGIIRWQNMLLSSERDRGSKESSLKHSYINRITDILGAVLNHACKYYGLPENPVLHVDKLSEVGEQKMAFWTREQFALFIGTFEKNPLLSASFNTLYWSGIREGELMALTWKDIDLEKGVISVTKTMHIKNGIPVITSPKTLKGKRSVRIPRHLCEAIAQYKKVCVDALQENQAFPVTPSILFRKMKAGCKACGLQPIRIHDLRHSHVSLLIHLGFSAVDIAERMGHESTDITFHYAHLFPSEQERIAAELDTLRTKRNRTTNLYTERTTYDAE